jgi:hypothetical protein
LAHLRSVIAIPLLLLAACSAAATGVRVGGPRLSDGDSFRMRPGTSVTVPGEGTLVYVKVVGDSRCKPDVQCVWAGDAEVAFEWRPTGGKADAFSLHTGKGDKSHRVGRHVLALVALARGDAPEAQLSLAAAQLVMRYVTDDPLPEPIRLAAGLRDG